MKQELIDLLENYGIENSKKDSIVVGIDKILKSRLSVIDEGSLKGESSIIVLSGGDEQSFVLGWKRYEKFVKLRLGIER